MVDRPVIFSITLAGAVALLTLGSALTQEPESAFAADGVGGSPLVEDARLEGYRTQRLLTGPAAFHTDPDHDPGSTLLVMIGPERSYDKEEIEAVRGFLEEGGRLLVVDAFGQANSVSAGLGILFERVRLVQEEPTMPITLEGQTFQVSLRDSTALRVEDQDMPHRLLASSAQGSFLDRDGNGLIGAGDPGGPFPVSLSIDVGPKGGRVVAFADMGPFLVTGADAEENREFRSALLHALLPDGGTVVVDESRDPSRDPWLVTVGTVVGILSKAPWRYVAAAAVLTVFVMGMVIRAIDHWGPHRFDPDRFVRRRELLQTDSRAGMDAKDARPTAAWTTRGRAAVFGGTALAALGVWTGSIQATYAASFLLLAAAQALWVRPARVTAQRTLSTVEAHEDSIVEVDLQLHAQGRERDHVEVLDGVPIEFDLESGTNWFQTTVTPKAAIQSRYAARPSLRGPYQVGPTQVRSTDALRLRTAQTLVREAEAIRVHPRHEPLSGVPFTSKIIAMTLGPHLVNRAGDGSEFHALRDYQTGDSIRSVNWKASARSRKLVVNQRIHESMSTITVLIDARLISGAGPVRRAPLNESCRAALSIVAGAVQARDRVRVYTYGNGVRDIAPGKGAQQVHDLSNALAELEAVGSMTFNEALDEILPTTKPRSPCILLSGFEADPSVLEGIRRLREREVIPFVVAMPVGTEPMSSHAGEPEPRANHIQAEHKAAVKDLRGAGVATIPMDHDMSLSVALRLGVI